VHLREELDAVFQAGGAVLSAEDQPRLFRIVLNGVLA
jgi:hypothetical protein